MTFDAALDTDGDLAAAIAHEYRALSDLLEEADPVVWDAPSLCEGWRTREVVAHMTMPARYSGPEFMAELAAAGGDFTQLSNTVAARDGALPVASLLADLRSEALHGWQPPGGGLEGALTHCVIHGLDITEAVPAGPARPGLVHPSGARDRRPDGFAQPLRRRPLRRGTEGGGPGLVLWDRRAGLGNGAVAGPGGLWPRAAAGPARRRGGRALHAALKGWTSCRASRCRGPDPPPACSTRTGRPARPVGQGAPPRAGKQARPARTSHTVSTMPRFTS